MAYTRELPHKQCYWSSCQAKPKLEVFNQYNGSVGEFCRHHAEQKLIELRQWESDKKERVGREIS